MKEYFNAPIRKLGFGLMRLPEKPGGDIDFEMVKKMVDLYLERGFSYFDTAFVYNGGQSEEAFRVAVAERYPRDKFQATTKLPLWQPVNFEQMKEMTMTSLNRMGLKYFDLYFLHGIGPDRLEMLDQIRAWDYLKKVKESGTSKNIGFSYHGDADTLNRILDQHAKDLDIIQLQINYLDWEDEIVQSRKCYEAAVKYGLGVIIMEPVKGGLLADFTPSVANVFRRANPKASFASWALRFAMNLDHVVTVLSGMSTMTQVEDNLQIADNCVPLSEAEMEVVAIAMEELKKVPIIPCTACRYCVDGCPMHINTPRIIAIVNDYIKYHNTTTTKRIYNMVTSGALPFGNGFEARSSDCTECGSCEEHCPQQIEIIETHKQAVELFE